MAASPTPPKTQQRLAASDGLKETSMSSAILTKEITEDLPKVPTRPVPKRLSPKRLALVGAALAILAGAGWYGHDWWTIGRFIESTDDAYVGGNITAIAPHVGGFIAEVLVSDNQFVKSGRTLVRLDQRDFQAALDHAAAVVDARVASLSGLRAQYVLQESTIRQRQADLAAKAAQLTFASQDAERYHSLAQTSAGSVQDAQRSQSLEQQARSTLLAGAAALEADRQQLKVLEAQIAEADASLAQARSDLQTARLNLGYTEIRAPIDGYVGNRAAQVGAYVAAGAYLISVIPSDGLWVDANFKEDQLTDMADGDAATIVADVLPGHAFHGHVASLSPGTGAVFSVIPAENATGNFTKIVQRVPVRVALDAGDPALKMLRPGLSTTAGVDTRPERRNVP
jgi:membrane fusion protein (multidrug efflux system)